jgi:hypothetical protein
MIDTPMLTHPLGIFLVRFVRLGHYLKTVGKMAAAARTAAPPRKRDRNLPPKMQGERPVRWGLHPPPRTPALNDHRPASRNIRSAGGGDTRIFLELEVRRIDCRGCGKVKRETARIEAGSVSLPRSASWLDEFRREIMAFPAGRYTDQVDAFSQALKRAFTDRPGKIGVGIIGPGGRINWLDT